MKYIYLFTLTLFISDSAHSQHITPDQATRRLSHIFEDDRPKPQVLLLGIFHFAGEKVDSNSTPVSLRVDMLSPERQQQVSQLIRKLETFRPTKIVVEWPPYMQHYLDSLFHAYCDGQPMTSKYLSPVEEIIQLGFRLAQSQHLPKVYPVDAQAFRFRLSPADSVLTFEKYKDQQDTALDYWDKKYDEASAYDDSIQYYLPLIDYLRYLNSPETQARAIGRWLIATRRGSNSEPIGADGFITRYFNRNVRIYSNIQRIVTSREDRILVIYGATHMYMLKQLFTASPEFRLANVMEYLK